MLETLLLGRMLVLLPLQWCVIHLDTLSAKLTAVFMSISDFLCRDCDQKMLIKCWNCERPFPQPEWYYRHTGQCSYVFQ